MIQIVTGGSGSGKSEYAETLALSGGKNRLYVATMRIWDEEGRRRVERHRIQREGKGFLTAEQYQNLTELSPAAFFEGKAAEVILLECMSNLVCNEFYAQEEGAFSRIQRGLRHLADCCGELIIVTNEVFSDGIVYDAQTERYLALLGAVNRFLGVWADSVTEVVYGIPLPVKAVSHRKEVR